jgi:hypothetical protein
MDVAIATQKRGVMKKFLTFVAAILAMSLSAQAYAQDIQRLSAQFLRFDRTETTSSTAACGPGAVRSGCPSSPTPGSGGTLVYSHSVFAPFTFSSTGANSDVLYVTISAVGDNHGGESNYLSCNIDGPGGGQQHHRM